jgi:hypothetical protein
VIACCSSHERNRDETLNTLKYANRARNIKNAPVKVSALTMEEISALQRTLEALVHETLRLGKPSQPPEAIIARLDPESLFAAMVAIAQNLSDASHGDSAKHGSRLASREVAPQSYTAPLPLSVGAPLTGVLDGLASDQSSPKWSAQGDGKVASTEPMPPGSNVSHADKQLLVCSACGPSLLCCVHSSWPCRALRLA